MMKIYDVSLTLTSRMTVLPNQGKPSIKIKKSSKNDSVVTKIAFLSHNGTHVEAPRHFFKTGKTIEDIDPEKLIGRCKVIDLTNFFKAGGPAEIGWAHFENTKVKKGDRILLKTGNYQYLEGKRFTSDYISLSADAAKNLIKKQVSLVGIDYYSIEKRNNKDNPVHKSLLREGIFIVEGLNLKNVPAGEYLLVCAPLKIEGADASPARVFLIKE